MQQVDRLVTYMTHERDLSDPAVFPSHLDTVFRNEHLRREANAIAKLRIREQGADQSFAGFLPIFETQMASAGADTWNDDDLEINIRADTLSEELRVGAAY